MKIKGIVFDLDGVMFDSERMNVYLMNERGAKYGIKVDVSYIASRTGFGPGTREQMPKDEFEAYPDMHFTHKDRAEFVKRHFKNPGDGNKPGLKELYEYARSKGLKVGVGSNSDGCFVYEMLSWSGFDLKMDAVVTGDDRYPSKPDPAIYLETAKRLGLKPEECIVIDDSESGINGGINAGMISILIEDIAIVKEETKKKVDYHLNNLFEVIDLLEELNKGE